MDRYALREALRAAGVADAYYHVEGVHEPVPTPPDHVFLRRGPEGGWETGVYERGSHEVMARHSRESDACDRLWRMLAPQR
ncbi:hypothetical protein ABT354_00245 [Streptomyces sp. NPDC000594]|uniref:hypothetical protein n=1 Tax=Streptomyces sp. NPDC000594 TaxID=3154261 RepID=UPI003322619F